jgi:hypothetical protein
MKNKFLQISLGVSMMLFSAGFLVRSVGSANAAPAVAIKAPALSVSGTDEWPMGISNGEAYWLEYSNGAFSFNKRALTDFK